jgi:hypothetical protein
MWKNEGKILPKVTLFKKTPSPGIPVVAQKMTNTHWCKPALIW